MKRFVLLTILAAAAFAQNQTGLKARELFYSPVPQATAQTPAVDPPKTTSKAATKTAPKQAASTTNTNTKQSNTTTQAKGDATKSAGTTADTTAHTLQASAPPLGLRYAVLKRDASGAFKEIDADTSFQSGDRIRLQIDANTAGYLYVVMQGSSGNWRLLFPSFEVAMGNNQVRKGQSLQIPPGDRGQFVFDEQAGTEKIFLMLTRQPEPNLEKLVYAISSQGRPASVSDPGLGRVIIAQATIGDDMVNRLRSDVQARDLVFEKVDSDDSPSANAAVAGARVENAAYVVNPSTAPDARLIVDVALKHH